MEGKKEGERERGRNSLIKEGSQREGRRKRGKEGGTDSRTTGRIDRLVYSRVALHFYSTVFILYTYIPS